MSTLLPRVVHVFPQIRPGGGPGGYGFNLRKALESAEVADREKISIVSPPQLLARPGQLDKPSWKFQLLRRLPPQLSGAALALHAKTITRSAFAYFGFTSDQMRELTSAKAVVFHDFRLASSYIRGDFKRNGQRILLMPHAPTDLSSELVENWRSSLGGSPRFWRFIRNWLITEEVKVFKDVDGIIVPCSYALEAYFRDTSYEELVLGCRLHKIETGVPELTPKHRRDEVLARWGIPTDKKIVGYFGRYHPHKGYDLFCSAATLAYEENDTTDIVFVSAGRGPLKCPTGLPNFFDLGYLQDELADVVASVDLVVVPNRVSYFDLFILEAMSLGKAILTTKVGGNKCLDSPGVFFLDENSARGILRNTEKLLAHPDQLREKGQLNKQTHKERYSLSAFAQRHIEFAKTILEN